MTCGLAVLALGLALGAAAVGVGAFGYARGMQARRVATLPIPVGQRVDTGWIEADTSKLCQVTLHMRADVPVNRGRYWRRSRTERDPAYRFPLWYTVLDESGEVVFRHDGKVPSGWSGPSRRRRSWDVVTLEAEHYLAKFTPPASGRIRVLAELADDGDGAVAHDPRLMVYDGVSSQRVTVFTVLGLLGLGSVLAGTGGVVAFLARDRG